MMKGTNTYSTLLVRRAVSSSSFLRHIRPRFMATQNTSSRRIFEPSKVSDTVNKSYSTAHKEVIDDVTKAIASNDVVVVGMAQNPHVKTARKALTEANINFHYMEYGSYFSQWDRRLAIKMWSGWPTFPQVYVKGVLIGGGDDAVREIQSGELQRRLSTQ